MNRKTIAFASIGIVVASTLSGLEGQAVAYSTPPSDYTSPVFLDMTVDMVREQARLIYNADELQWKCLDKLWYIESKWDYQAQGEPTTNGRALGIPQALPAIKMASEGLDYEMNPMTQVKWGLKYIKTRYQNKACYALRHELKRGWY
jgi:hypothetical protein